MGRALRAFPLPLFLCLLAGCSSVKVGVDHDESYAFAGKRTYAWAEGVPAASELHEERIAKAVETALAERGLRPVSTETPDLLVSTVVETHQELRSTGSSVGVGVGRRTSWGGVGIGTSTGDQIYEEIVGTLIITLADAGSGKTVWRASAADVITEDPEDTAERIAEAVEKAFRDFPPGD